MELHTERLVLRDWRDDDYDVFAALHADPAVMIDHGGPIGRAESDAKLDLYRANANAHGFTRWAVDMAGRFIGYVGIMHWPGPHPLGAHNDIGWRLSHDVWGTGCATEAAAAALRDGLTRCNLGEVLSYTAPGNRRSMSVMQRLELHRRADLDFDMHHNGRSWIAQVHSTKAAG